MVSINTDAILNWHRTNKQSLLHGRWIHLSHIESILKKLTEPFDVEKIGQSNLEKSIYKVSIGAGKINVLIWSQMHGNESTGTKAVFDLFRFFEDPKEYSQLRDQILSNCKITVVPMLNPDGAEAYTRVNASDIDLNRDVIDQKAPETEVLLNVLKEVNPKYCFNLHDQRTIYTVGATKRPASISFLAPSEDEDRSVTQGRKETMRVIVAMNELIQKIIPGQVGRYTDELYPTATGDNFQKMGHNTILIEGGHFQDDYQREKVRAFNFIALLQGLNYISSEKQQLDHKPYFDIPKNTEHYLDIIYKDVYLNSEEKKVDVGVLFKEIIANGALKFDPHIEQIGDLSDYGANSIIEEKGLIFENTDELQRFLKKRS